MVNFVRYSYRDWSALYQDGKLIVVGDQYLSDDYLAEFLKVDERHSDSYFLGQRHDYDSVAKTLVEVEEYEKNQSVDNTQAVIELREQAAELLKQAEALENQ